ncbi:hypothetical protein BGZ58_002258 [Dissophora ornata]|nr:hypothetical protein BGZ58_002258 [Dissophora ornata]
MPSNLQEIESRGSEHIRIENLHWAITNEVREDQNWENAYKLFSVYLAPVILASQKAAESSTSAHATSTSKLIEFEPDSEGNYTHEMTEQDSTLAQRSIAALVRYAPSPDESNIIYMFYLQCLPPFRNDDTINNCLISLIYRYAQVPDPETKAKGLDLVKVALERGIGLPGYQAIKPVATRYRRQPLPDRQQNSILASVSMPILTLLNKAISDDGQSLVDYVRPRGRYQPPRRGGYQQQQQQQHHHRNNYQQQQQPEQPQQQQPQRQQPQQQQHSYPPHMVQQQSNQQTGGQQPGRHGRQERQLLHSAQERAETTQNSRQEPTNSISDDKVEPQQESHNSNRKSGKGRAEYAAPVTDEVDQYTYYKQASHGFEGTVRGGGRGRGGGRDAGRGGIYAAAGGSSSGLASGHRTIAFVPASSNAALNTASQSAVDGVEVEEASAPAPTKLVEEGGSNDEDASEELVAGVEKLQLEAQAE